MTVRTRAQLKGDADTNLADNTTGDVSPSDVRQRVKDLADSALFIIEDVYTITDGASVDIDPGNAAEQFWTLTASRTPTATNFQNGQSIILRVADGTSAFSVNWGTIGVVWRGGSAPTLPTSGYAEISLSKAGGVIRGVHVGDFAS